MQDASFRSYLDHPRLAAFAVAGEPAWLWREDGSQVLWANATGAALFNAPNARALTSRHFAPSDAERRYVTNLSETLAADGAPRLERLRRFGTGLLMQPLVCACSRVRGDDGATAILICGMEPLRPTLSLADRARRLIEGSTDTVAAFSIAGDLLAMTETAQSLPSPIDTIAALGASAPAAQAIANGRADATLPSGRIIVWRVGRDADTMLIVRFERPEPAVPAGEQPLPQPAAPAEPATSAKADSDVSEARKHDETPQGGNAASLRRHPLRFVWELDSDQRFTVKSEEFLALAGPATAQRNGAMWGEICAALGIDPYQQVANAIATHDTWSGIVLSWPAKSGQHIRVELSGLPIFDRQRHFIGYRGFGVCRGTGRTEESTPKNGDVSPAAPRGHDDAKDVAREAPKISARPILSVAPPAANVVPFPAAISPLEQRPPGLTEGDRRAFSDIAQQLAARLRASTRSGPAATNIDEPAPLATSSSSRPQRIDGRATNPSALTQDMQWLAEGSEGRALLDLLPFGILIYRVSELLFANHAFLRSAGFASLDAFSEGGGLDLLQIGPSQERPDENGSRILSIETEKSGPLAGRLLSMGTGVEATNVLVIDEGLAPRPDNTAARTSIRENGHDHALDKILERQLDGLRQRLDETAAKHAEFLKHVNRDVRTPLTAIIGFAETILGERFGPIGNERYRDYLSGIRSAGGRILALVDGFDRDNAVADDKDAPAPRSTRTDIDLNAIVQTCVSELQPEASRDRVLIRTSLHRPLPEIAADASAVRQIVTNLLTNSIRLAGPGGQVILSTGVSGAGAVSLRLRDTGTGVAEADVTGALESKAVPGERTDSPEGRLKLAVARALLEANRASLKISSRPEEGTLVEVSFHERSSPAA
jgi:signal transduction histidine kinase